jgi:hypothetical protein
VLQRSLPPLDAVNMLAPSSDTNSLPEEPILTPKLDSRWALSPWHLTVIVFWGLLFYVLNMFPLRETDLWGHVAYGKWILEHFQLPAEDPFAPLTAGMQVTDSAWLAQVIYAAVYRWGGGEALSLLFATTMLGMYLLLARIFYLQSRNLVVVHVSVLLVVVVGWSRVSTIRPENFGTLCFAVLLWLLASSGQTHTVSAESPAESRKMKLRLWLGVPLLMAIWANLHGSFVCGYLMLGCYAGGALVEAVWRTRSVQGELSDAAVQRWAWLLELAVVATFANPYGVDLVLHTIWFADLENLREISEWQPMQLTGVSGPEFVLSIVVMLFAFRHSRRRIPVADVLLLSAFGAAVIGGIRMIWWYAAVWGVCLTPHLADLWSRLEPVLARVPRVGRIAAAEPLAGLPRGRSWSYSLVGLLLVWISFAVSPAGNFFVSHSPRSPERLLTNTTPWKITAYLREHPPQGQVFNPQWWGDWLLWDGPENLQVFMTTNMHLVPHQTWNDYRVVRETRSGWANVLDRYRVETVVLDKQRQMTLMRYLRNSRDWRATYEDDAGMVFRRLQREGRRADGKDEPVGMGLTWTEAAAADPERPVGS